MDTKAYGFESRHRGRIGPGDPLHGLWLRLTIAEDMTVAACVASSDHTPYAICPAAAPNFAGLAGLRIGPGFNRAVAERVGGVQGCTHLREVLAQMATVAFQTLYPLRRKQERAEAGKTPALLGTCVAYAPDSPVTHARWPHLAPGGAAPVA